MLSGNSDNHVSPKCDHRGEESAPIFIDFPNALLRGFRVTGTHVAVYAGAIWLSTLGHLSTPPDVMWFGESVEDASPLNLHSGFLCHFPFASS